MPAEKETPECLFRPSLHGFLAFQHLICVVLYGNTQCDVTQNCSSALLQNCNRPHLGSKCPLAPLSYDYEQNLGAVEMQLLISAKIEQTCFGKYSCSDSQLKWI